jgi:hypothetical protein
MNDPKSKAERDIAPLEPAFIRRLPQGVDYTLIRTIFIDLPSRLPTLLWATGSDSNPLVRAFNNGTVRAILRALRRAEDTEKHELIAGIRRELVQLCLQELTSPWSPHPDLMICEQLVRPDAFAEGHRPPGPPVQHLRITVFRKLRAKSRAGSVGPRDSVPRFGATRPRHPGANS